MSKLDPTQKATLKQMRADTCWYQKGVEIYHFPNFRATVAIRRTGSNMAEASVSICSKEEPKFRRKIGEYWARIRMKEGRVFPIELGSRSMEETAHDIACFSTTED